MASQSILQDWVSSDSGTSSVAPLTGALSSVTRTSSVSSLCFKEPAAPHKTSIQKSSSVSVINPFNEFSEDEGEFIQLLINAKTVADMNEAQIPVEWRGYETIVHPNLPPFTKKALRERLSSALQHLQVLYYITFFPSGSASPALVSLHSSIDH